MSPAALTILMGIVAAVLTLAACGGSDSGSDDEPIAGDTTSETKEPTGKSESRDDEPASRKGDGEKSDEPGRKDQKGEKPERKKDRTPGEEPAEGEDTPPPAEEAEEENEGDSGLSKAEFITRADRNCRAFRREERKLDKGRTREDRLRYLRRLSELVNEVAREQKAIPLPSEGTGGARRYIDLLEEGARVLERIVRAVEDEDEDRIERLSDRNKRISARAVRLTESYGFKVCGSPN